MIRSCRSLWAAAMLALLGAPLAAAQRVEISLDTFDRPALRILQDYILRPDDGVRQVVVIGGDARIEGKVTQDVVVILGKAQLASTAVIEGSFVVVAGTAEVADGAKVGGDFVVVGDARSAPSFSPGGQHVVIGMAGLGESLRALVPWLTHGLLLGRPIVPWLGWVWLVAAIFFLINLALAVLFEGPVRACAVTLRATPFSAFMAGLLVLLLAGPVCVLLAVSVIGIAVIPFVLCAMLAAALLGRVAFARWLGMSVLRQEDLESRGESLRSFAIGSALMCGAYMIPFVGLVVWTLAGVFGLGAATLAFYSSYRRENPRPPKKVRTEAPAGPAGGGGVAPPAGDAARSEPPVPDAAAAVVTPAVLDVAIARGGAADAVPAELPKATFVERLAALALDAIVIAIAAQFLGFDRDGAPFERLTLLLALAYHVGFWTWRGATLGGIICQLRVVRVDGRRLEFAEALVRGLTGVISLAVAGLGFLWILRDPERQGWHDRVAGTYVVKVPRSYPV